MSDAVDVQRLGALLVRHLSSLRLPLGLVDEMTGERHRMQVETAGAADGALPIFLAAADAVCREALSQPIGINLEPDGESLLGVRISGVNGVPFSVTMLCLMEAIDRAKEPDALVVNNLSKVASLARQHALQAQS